MHCCLGGRIYRRIILYTRNPLCIFCQLRANTTFIKIHRIYFV